MKTTTQTTRQRKPARTKVSARRLQPALSPETALPDESLHPKALLVPTDFSEAAGKAVDDAVAWAERFGATISLLHVVEPPLGLAAEATPFGLQEEQLVQQARENLCKLAQERIDDLVPVGVEVELGRSYQKICETAQKLNSDLVVISTHGSSGWKHLVFGSTAERVVRHAPCSVLVVRGDSLRNADGQTKPKNILVPTDFSEHAELAWQHALSMARESGATLHLLHVTPPSYLAGAYDQVDLRRLDATSQVLAQKKLDKMVKAHAREKVSLRAENRYGRPAAEITDAARELDCDLIVLSTHGLTGWNRMLLGSTTEEVVRHAGCPVLVVRQKQTEQK